MTCSCCLDALGIERASVVGASFGGRVALELASTWPERVERLVLLCSAWEGVDPDPALASFAAEQNRLLDAVDVDGALELSSGPGSVPTRLTRPGPWSSSCSGARSRSSSRPATTYRTRSRDVDPGAVRARALMVSGAHDFPRFRLIAARSRITSREGSTWSSTGRSPALAGAARPDYRAAPPHLAKPCRQPRPGGGRKPSSWSATRAIGEASVLVAYVSETLVRGRPQMRRFAGAEGMAGRGCGRQGVHTARAHACASVAREGCRRDRPRRRDWPGTSFEISLIRGF